MCSFDETTEDFSQAYVVPVGLGANIRVMPIVDVGGEFMLPLAVGGIGVGSALETRRLMVYSALRTK